MTQGGNDYTFTTFEASDIMHRAASFCRASNSSHEYGNGESYTATEVHFLNYVVENPGISAIELAHSWNKTRAAATQMLTKLERSGLLYRGRERYNEKKVLYYPTEKGLELHEMHRSYDTENFGKFISYLEQRFTKEQIESAFQILQAYSDYHMQMDEFK